MIKNFKKLQQAGDTIVEVMVVLTVLGMALGMTYAIASRSLLNARQAQENSEATMLLKTQIEALRILAPQIEGMSPGDPDYDAKNVFITNDSFCIDTSNSSNLKLVKLSQDTTKVCHPDNSLYQVSITYCKNNSANNNCKGLGAAAGVYLEDTFVAQATWEDISSQGGGSDSATLVYKVHD